MTEQAKLVEIPQPLRLDLGCGKNKREGFVGVDCRDFGQDIVCDLSSNTWSPEKLNNDVSGIFYTNNGDGCDYLFLSESVDEVYCSHFVEHLNSKERINFVNELYRVLKKGAKAQIITPHWNSNRAYGDLTHQWPPVSEFWFYYLNKEWRSQNAPHNDFYVCDFDATWGYSMRSDLHVRNQEYQMFALSNYKEAAQDIIATLIKK